MYCDLAQWLKRGDIEAKWKAFAYAYMGVFLCCVERECFTITSYSKYRPITFTRLSGLTIDMNFFNGCISRVFNVQRQKMKNCSLVGRAHAYVRSKYSMCKYKKSVAFYWPGAQTAVTLQGHGTHTRKAFDAKCLSWVCVCVHAPKLFDNSWAHLKGRWNNKHITIRTGF